MTIKTKLSIIFSTFSILIIAVVGINFLTYKSMDSDANFVNQAGRLRANSFRMAYLSSHIVLNNETGTEDNKLLLERVQYFDNLLMSLQKGDAETGLKAPKAEEISVQLQDIQNKWNLMFKPVYISIAENPEKELLKSVDENITEYVQQIDGMVTRYSEIAQGKVVMAKTLSGVFLGISLILAVFSFIVIRRGIIQPIKMISKDLKDISSGNGDLTKVIQLNNNDEIGILTDYFNKFIASIKDIVVLISKSSVTLTTSIDAISGTSDELAKSTEMIAGAVSDVSAGSVEQSEMVKTMTGLVNDMSSDIRQVINNAVRLLEESGMSSKTAGEGNAAIQRHVKELEAVVGSTKKVSDTVNHLEKYSFDIRDILEIINNISQQTNLLALNASIEAARAGEAGRGFAVVAEEIRKLAEETAKSTVRIVDIVQNISGQTSEVKKHMDEMVETIDIQAKSMNDVKVKLNEISEKSNITYECAKDIQSINSKIYTNFTVINESANRISLVVEKNSENTQEVAAAVQEQTASFQEVAANMSMLIELSKQLNEVVASFRT
ncbi:MAG: methyl-accepting chemotaxis protein [Eubacterium sp.]|nr:methyl-accepting chemotaxis protein [Eubacterium sp.]